MFPNNSTFKKHVVFQTFPKTRKYFGMFGLFCKINCYFEYRIRILCIFLYMGTYFKWISDISPSSPCPVVVVVLCPSVPSSVPSSSSVLCPSVPSSVPSSSSSVVVMRRRRPSSVVVVRRPSSSSVVVVRLSSTCKTSLKHPSDGVQHIQNVQYDPATPPSLHITQIDRCICSAAALLHFRNWVQPKYDAFASFLGCVSGCMARARDV